MIEPAQTTRLDPDDALEVLAHISDSLVESYQELSARALRVEEELCRTNAELEKKILELNAVSSHLEAILQALPTGVVVRDGAHRIVRVNGAALEILGVHDAYLEGSPGLALPPPDGTTLQCEIVRPDGAKRTVATVRSRVWDRRGEPVGSVQILDDRTELSRLTERLHRVDKIAALGNVAAGIAHEIRNPLNAIKGFAALLRRDQEPESKAHRWSSLIVTGVDEIDAIVTSMLSFARPEGMHKETINGRELVSEAISAAALGASWSVETKVDVPDFVGDRIKLRHALRNLIANSQNAQPDGGRIKVGIKLSAGDVVCTVDDAGPGVPENIRRRVFDPFFTTRAQGTGLGLSLVTTIAELHGGSVDVSDEPSPLAGARIVLKVPFESPGAGSASLSTASPNRAA